MAQSTDRPKNGVIAVACDDGDGKMGKDLYRRRFLVVLFAYRIAAYHVHKKIQPKNGVIAIGDFFDIYLIHHWKRMTISPKGQLQEIILYVFSPNVFMAFSKLLQRTFSLRRFIFCNYSISHFFLKHTDYLRARCMFLKLGRIILPSLYDTVRP